MPFTDQLYRTINASVPILGVSIGDPANRATWQITFLAGTSAANRAAATAILNAFDPADPAVLNADKDLDAATLDTDLRLKAVAATLWEEIQKCQVLGGQVLRTKQQCLDRVKVIYRSLL